MPELDISALEIETVERLLLPDNAHFSDDARAVIKCWNSTDVAACPGSGKTTVLLAKLKLLADRMPFDDGAGICVLSHTNVAVNEIKARLTGCTDKLLSYPNYIGTIQAFIDHFITMPYLKRVTGRSVQAVDDETYAKHVYGRMGRFRTLKYVVDDHYKHAGNHYNDEIDHVKQVYLNDRGALYIGREHVPLAGAKKPSTDQYKQLLDELLKVEGLITYSDAYRYAQEAIDELSDEYVDLFKRRFRYVLIDEYQDCNQMQQDALNKVFDPANSVVIHIGDPDQAIYASEKDTAIEWIPDDAHLSISCSNRYSQEIANALKPLKKCDGDIVAKSGSTGISPVLLVYDIDHINRVLDAFILLLEEYGLTDSKGTYKAIGMIRKEDGKGIKIGSYWDGFDGSKKADAQYSYWSMIDNITEALTNGKLYLAEHYIRKMLCRLFHYAEICDADTQKEFTVYSIKNTLDIRCSAIYRDNVLNLCTLRAYDRNSVDEVIRCIIDGTLEAICQDKETFYKSIPKHFWNEPILDRVSEKERNVFIEPIRGRRIQFDTVHGVKGQTHDATLYLETEYKNGSDIARILPYLGDGRVGASALFDYSRRVAYVAMSRPKKLLCVAVQNSTYKKAKKAFHDWRRIELREYLDYQ